MGCGVGFDDDLERCGALINDYQFLLNAEAKDQLMEEKTKKNTEDKEYIKENIKNRLESLMKK